MAVSGWLVVGPSGSRRPCAQHRPAMPLASAGSVTTGPPVGTAVAAAGESLRTTSAARAGTNNRVAALLKDGGAVAGSGSGGVLLRSGSSGSCLRRESESMAEEEVDVDVAAGREAKRLLRAACGSPPGERSRADVRYVLARFLVMDPAMCMACNACNQRHKRRHLGCHTTPCHAGMRRCNA